MTFFLIRDAIEHRDAEVFLAVAEAENQNGQ
jgi:hypothetical protein